jgi:lactate dehydrogenase-like 2-hydroxyacid dehydrogenase
MKVVAYSVKPFEKEFFATANQKKHDITLIFNSLDLDTVMYAKDKQAVIVFTSDDVSEHVIEKLANYGVQYITTRSSHSDNIDKEAAARYGIKLASVPEYSEQEEITLQTIKNLDSWEKNKCLGKSCVCANDCKR